MIDLHGALAKLESVNTERTFIEINLARYFVSYVLGTTWDEKFIALGTKPDPWMLNANDAWLAAHPVAAPDLRRVTCFNRIIRLSDALFTLTRGKVDDFELLRQRFLKRQSPRAPFTEAEIASLLVRNGCGVRIIGESGVRGADFDMLATVRGVDVSVEVTEIGTELKVSSLVNKLKSKGNQVPKNRPAVIYVHVPAHWMKNRTLAFLIMNQAITRFMRGSRRYNAVIIIWEEMRAEARANREGGALKRFLQPVYNNRPRWPIRDLTAFGLKSDKWGSRAYANSLLDFLRTSRLRKQIASVEVSRRL
jgi:hypothetical protein